MSFVSTPYLASLSADQRLSLTTLGYHPETQDELCIPTLDREAGTYILGVQGTGKSGELRNLIHADMQAGHAVIVIDAHGDLTRDCLSDIPPERVANTFVLDMEDEAFPFGINLFSTGRLNSSLDAGRAISRLMHIFEVLWPEVATQQNLPRYVRAVAIAFLANPGTTLVDMYTFLRDEHYRARLLMNVKDASVREFWRTEYDNLGPHEQYRRVQSVIGRLETLFMGRTLVKNIVGQRTNSVSFRKAVEQKQIILIRLPVKTVTEDARLIGTILMAQIHAAIFSFADTPADKRPGVSLYVDEFQHFATSDFSELFTEGRKFGLRLTIAHQFRGQLPGFLRDSTVTALTNVCFRVTPEDGREMAHLFPSQEATVQAEDIELHPTHYLLAHPSNDPVVREFTETYLHPMQGHRRGAGRVEITQLGAPSIADVFNGGRAPNPRVTDPTWQLDSLLHETMREGNPYLPVAPEIVDGFSNCGVGFYKVARGLGYNDRDLTMEVRFPKGLVVEVANGELHWTRRPESATEQFYHFIFHLRMLMVTLANNPIGKATTVSSADVGRMLMQLPNRSAFVRSGKTVGVVYTHDTPPRLTNRELYDRASFIMEHTRDTYCRPRQEVEQELIDANPSTSTGFDASQPIKPVIKWEEVE